MLRFIVKRADGKLATLDIRSLGAIESEIKLGGDVLGIELLEDKGAADKNPPKQLQAV